MTPEGKDWVGFDHYITREDKRRRLEEGKKEKIMIEPTDTKHTLNNTQAEKKQWVL
jgi:hypothetical protein